MTPGSFGSSQTRSLAEIQNRGGTGSAFPGDGDGWRQGESGGKRRGDRELPLGGRRRSGGGRSWALHGEGRTAAGLVAGGATPAMEGGKGWVGELQEGNGVPFQGLVWGVEGWKALNRKGRRGGRAGTQRPGGDLSREGDGEVAGCATPSAVCHAGRRRGRVPLARAARGDG